MAGAWAFIVRRASARRCASRFPPSGWSDRRRPTMSRSPAMPPTDQRGAGFRMSRRRQRLLAAAALALWAATEISGWLLWASCALGWTLLALGLIDLRCSRLPDLLTLPTLVAGLAVTALAWPAELPDHLLGAVLGYSGLVAI